MRHWRKWLTAGLASAVLAGCGQQATETTATPPPVPAAPAPEVKRLSEASLAAWREALTAIDATPDLVLAREPQATGFDGAKAIVEFETLRPTPPAVVYFGATLPEEDLDYPRYRKDAVEVLPEGETTTRQHKVLVDVSKLESKKADHGLLKNNGGVVHYRVEVWDPGTGRAETYDHRFRYKRDGEPGSGTYQLLPTIVDGPFLDLVTADGATVSWETDQPQPGSVLIAGRRLQAKEARAKHIIRIGRLRPDTWYEYTVAYGDGEAGPYRFRTAPAPGSQRPIRFGYMSDSREGVGGGEHGQNGVNTRVVAQFASALYRHNVDFICFGGDLINGYTSDAPDFRSQLRTWKNAFQPVAARVPVYEAMGNHEQVGDYFEATDPEDPARIEKMFTSRAGQESAEFIFAQEFVNPLGSAYGFPAPAPEAGFEGGPGEATGPTYEENVYSFNVGNMHLVALNSNYWYTGGTDDELALQLLGGNREGYLMDNQLEWLSKDLAAASDDETIDWIFIFLHEPAFPCGGHEQDAMYWHGLNDPALPRGDVTAMRDRFWSMLAGYPKVIAVLFGDEHNYSRTLIDSGLDPSYTHPVWQIVSGGAGAPFYSFNDSLPWSDRVKSFVTSIHYCVLEVAGDRVGIEVYDSTGKLVDAADLSSIRKR